MKKKFIIMIICLFIILGFLLKYFIIRNNYHISTNNFKTKFTNTSSNDYKDNLDEVESNISEETENTIVEKENLTSKENKPVNNNKTNKEIIKQNKEKTTDNSENVIQVVPAEKHECTNSDVGYVKWLAELKSTNKSTRIFNSLNEATSFGYSKAEYGYGFFYSKNPTKYEDSNCSKEIYTLQLYVAAKSCGDNPMMYLSSDEEPINTITYLRNLGYVCPEKVVVN